MYQPLFISEAFASDSDIVISECEHDVDTLLRLFHLHYKRALSFYRTSFFDNTDKTIGCLSLNPGSMNYSFMKSYDFNNINLEDNFIYIREGESPKINNFRNFYCSYSTLLKFSSCYKYFIDFKSTTNINLQSSVFIHDIMNYVLGANMKVKVVYE